MRIGDRSIDRALARGRGTAPAARQLREEKFSYGERSIGPAFVMQDHFSQYSPLFPCALLYMPPSDARRH